MTAARAAAIVVALLAPPAWAGGETLVVNSKKDKPDANLVDGVCDADLAEPGQQITLRAAVMHAATTVDADLIRLPRGVFRLTRKSAVSDTPDTGDLDVPNALTIEGAGAKKTIIDAKGLGDRILQGSDCALTLRDVTLRKGRLAVIDADGGGLFGASVTLVMERCVVSGCRATAIGGGIALVNGSAQIVETTFKDNRAINGGGASLILTGFLIDRCTFDKNHADDTGGGVSAKNALADLKNSTFSANDAANGGAIAFGDGGTWGVTSCTLAKNFAESGSGIFEDLADGSQDQIEITNSIVANLAGSNFSGGNMHSNGGNLENGTTCGFGDATDQSETNPRLTKLKKRGGPTATHGLKESSPAIDRAVDADAPATDQRGTSRVDVPGVGTAVADCGAFEFEP